MRRLDLPIGSSQIAFGKKGSKYFVGYKDVKKVRPAWIMLPKMSAYRRDFDEIKYTSFLIKIKNS